MTALDASLRGLHKNRSLGRQGQTPDRAELCVVSATEAANTPTERDPERVSRDGKSGVNDAISRASTSPTLTAERPMRIAVIVLSLLATLPCAAQAQPAKEQPIRAQPAQAHPTQDRLLESLRRELIDKLQASGKFSSIAVTDRSTLKATSLDGREFSISLDTLAGNVSARPQQRAEQIATFTRTIIASAEPIKPTVTKEEFVASLRLVIRHKDYLTEIGRAGDPKVKQDAPLWRPFAGEALAFVAIDYGERLEIVKTGKATTHGISDEALFDLGLEQLKRFLPDMETEDASGVRAFVASDDAYSPSLLLLDEPWKKVERDFGVGFVVAIPDRTTLLAAPAKYAAQLRKAVELVAKSRKSPPLIPHLIQRSGTGWIVFAGR